MPSKTITMGSPINSNIQDNHFEDSEQWAMQIHEHITANDKKEIKPSFEFSCFVCHGLPFRSNFFQSLEGSKMSMHALMPLITRYLEFKSGWGSHCLFQMNEKTTFVCWLFYRSLSWRSRTIPSQRAFVEVTIWSCIACQECRGELKSVKSDIIVHNPVLA